MRSVALSGATKVERLTLSEGEIVKVDGSVIGRTAGTPFAEKLSAYTSSNELAKAMTRAPLCARMPGAYDAS